MMTPTVSIVILNWNGWPDIRKCLEHVLAQDYRQMEIIIVDNASDDGSLALLKSMSQSIIFIENEANLGFAKGMNIGISQSSGEYVVALNQDAFLHPTFISAGVRTMQNGTSIGMVGGPVFPVSNSHGVARTGSEPELGIVLRRYFRGTAPLGNQLSQLLGPSGCCPFFRRAALEDVRIAPGEYFDEMYGTGGEDVDLFLRLHLRNWRPAFTADMVAHHVKSGSVGHATRLIDKPLWYQRNALRNRYYSIIKDIPFGVLLQLLPFLLAAEIGMWLFYLLTSPKTLVALLWSWKDLVKTLPEILRRRRRIQAERISESAAISRLFV